MASRDHAPSITAVTSGQSPGQRLYAACAEAFGYTRGWESGTPHQHRKYERAATAFVASDPLIQSLLDALKFYVEIEERCLANQEIATIELDQRLETARAAIARAEGK